MTISVTHATNATLPNDPSKEVSSDAWNEEHQVTGLATVASTGDYNDLINKPSAGVTLADVIDALYPVGSIYSSTLSTNPGTLLGRGTWATFGAGRVLVGRDANDTDFDTAEETGGAKTVTSTGTISQPTFTGTAAQSTSAISAGTPTGTIAWPAGVPTNGTVSFTPSGTIAWPVGVPTFTGAALGTHAHELPWQIATTTTIRQIAVATFGTGTSRAATAVSASGTANTTSAAVALSQAVSAGTPTGTVAWPAGVPTLTGSSGTVPAQTISWPAGVPTLTGAALGTHQHTITAGGTVSQPTFTGDATSVVQPYIVVYMWKRTA